MTSPTPPSSAPRPYVWSRAQYDHLLAAGVFAGKPVELVDGQVLDVVAPGSAHATAVARMVACLTPMLEPGTLIRSQRALDLGALGQPVPDVAVVTGQAERYGDHHPTYALLVVEVADVSLDYDRTHKARLYARAGLPDYWVLNLVDRQIEVYRQPSPTDYLEHTIYQAGDVVGPLAVRYERLAVADVVPPLPAQEHNVTTLPEERTP